MIAWVVPIGSGIVAIAQSASATLLAMASAVVGAVALNINYRNSKGWKPIVLIPSFRKVETQNPDGIATGVSFEVWNRQKYPVVVRKMRVMFSNIRLTEPLHITRGEQDKNWYVTGAGQRVERWGDVVIEPNKHAEFVVDVRVAEVGDFEIFARSRATVEILVSDPKRNKNYTLRGLSDARGRGLPW